MATSTHFDRSLYEFDFIYVIYTFISTGFYIIHSIRYGSPMERKYSHEAVCSQGFAVSLREFRPREKKTWHRSAARKWKVFKKTWLIPLMMPVPCHHEYIYICIYTSICIFWRTFFQPSDKEIYRYFPGESATDKLTTSKTTPLRSRFQSHSMESSVGKGTSGGLDVFFVVKTMWKKQTELVKGGPLGVKLGMGKFFWGTFGVLVACLKNCYKQSGWCLVISKNEQKMAIFLTKWQANDQLAGGQALASNSVTWRCQFSLAVVCNIYDPWLTTMLLIPNIRIPLCHNTPPSLHHIHSLKLTAVCPWK